MGESLPKDPACWTCYRRLSEHEGANHDFEYPPPKATPEPVPSKDLLPCPFCGGEAEIIRVGDRCQSAQVGCTECSCTLESCDEGERSGWSWNTRTAPVASERTVRVVEGERMRPRHIDSDEY